ncbi:FxsA family protein [Dermacoccus barathri]
MLALLVIPVIEVFIIIKMGQTIGGWPTFGLLVLWSALGAWIVKRESGRAFGALRQAFGSGRMPARELSDAALILVGGTLLLAPGFFTDFLGLFFLLPFTRPFTRKLLEKVVAAKLLGSVQVASFGPGGFSATRGFGAPDPLSRPYPTSDSFGGSGATSSTHASSRRRTRSASDDVVEGEIID